MARDERIEQYKTVDPESQTLSVYDAEKYAGLARTFLMPYLVAGKVPATIVDGQITFNRRDFCAFMGGYDARDYRVPEAAKLIGVTNQTIINYCESGKLRAKKFGKTWLIHEEDLKNIQPGATKRAHTITESTAQWRGAVLETLREISLKLDALKPKLLID